MSGRGTGGRWGVNHPGNIEGDRAARSIDRQLIRDALTPEDQLAILDNRLGVGIGASRERKRLALILENNWGQKMYGPDPVVTLLAVNPQAHKYVREVALACTNAGVSFTTNKSKEKIGVKIRKVKTPHTALIGAEEVANRTVTLRMDDSGENLTVSLESFITRMSESGASNDEVK